MKLFNDPNHPLARALDALMRQRLLMLVPDFLDRAACASLMKSLPPLPLAQAEFAWAAENGAKPLRKGSLIQVPADIEASFNSRMDRHLGRIGAHFGLQPGGRERVQFIKERPGDYFSMHRDQGKEPGYSDRRLSVIVFLNDQQSQPGFVGGQLSLFVRQSQASDQLTGVPLPPAPGMMAVFDARLMQELTPITAGERYSIATWLTA